MAVVKRTPLQRKTPMARTQMARGTSTLARTTRVKPQSAKRKVDADIRRVLVAVLLHERPRCEARWVCQGARSVDIHERIKRSRGGSITDPVQAHMVALCRPCHEMTEAEPAEATRRRMLLPSWHKCPPIGPC